MKVSALLLTQLLAFSAEARLHDQTRKRTREMETKATKDIDRIINGVEADEDRYSYIVSLHDNQGHFCGASLIAKDIVLSAAHCAGGGYNAVIGRHKQNDKDGDEVGVSDEFVHPNYNSGTTSNDFMVLVLSRETTANVVPVKINSSSSSPRDSDSVVVMGWGLTNENSSNLSNKLMEVTVDVVSDSDCRQAYGSEFIASTMLCAASPSKDSCQGDSGGPLIIKGSNAASDVQVGVVSWGYGCASPEYPGVYAEISSAYDFIKQIVCQESKDAQARDSYQCSGQTSGAAIAPSDGGSTSTSGSLASQGNDDFNYDDVGSSSSGGGGGGNQGSGGFGGGRPDGFGGGGGNFGGFGGSTSGGSTSQGGWDDYGYDDGYDYDYDDSYGSSSGSSFGGGGGWQGSGGGGGGGGCQGGGGGGGGWGDWWKNLWH